MPTRERWADGACAPTRRISTRAICTTPSACPRTASVTTRTGKWRGGQRPASTIPHGPSRRRRDPPARRRGGRSSRARSRSGSGRSPETMSRSIEGPVSPVTALPITIAGCRTMRSSCRTSRSRRPLAFKLRSLPGRTPHRSVRPTSRGRAGSHTPRRATRHRGRCRLLRVGRPPDRRSAGMRERKMPLAPHSRSGKDNFWLSIR